MIDDSKVCRSGGTKAEKSFSIAEPRCRVRATVVGKQLDFC